MADSRLVCLDPVRGVYEDRWDQPPPQPGWCWTPWHSYHTGSAHLLPGTSEHCAPQCCAGHRWTHCADCGRSGDRSGDECVLPCG